MSLLLYLVVATVFVLVCRRRAGLVLVVLPLCLVGRAMITGAIYGPLDLAYTSEPFASIAHEVGVGNVANPILTDVYTQMYPWNESLRWAIGRGEWPLWSPFAYAGDLLAAAAQSAPYHPVTLLALLLPSPDAITFTAAMLFLLAAASMDFFLRDLELGDAAALFGAAAWMFSTHVITFTGTALGLATAVMPLVLLGGRRVVRAPSVRSALLLLVALLLVILAGHPETVLHAVVLGVLYVAHEIAKAWPIDVRRVLAAGVGAGVAALLLSAIFLVPMLAAIPDTMEYQHRAVDPPPASAWTLVAHRVRASFIPFVEGVPGEAAPHPPPVQHGWLPVAYCGSLVFAAALFGAGRSRSWFWCAIFVFGLLAGANAPGVTQLLQATPGFAIAVNDRMISWAAIALSILAAYGIDGLRRSLAWTFLGTAIAIALVALAWSAGLSRELIVVSLVRMLVPLLLAAFAVLVARERAAPILVALVVLQRIVEASGIIPTVPRAAYYPAIAGISDLPRGGEPYRIVGVGELLAANTSAHYLLEDVRGIQALTNARLAQTFPLWCKPQPVWFNRVDDLRAPFLSLMNVRYAFAPARMAAPEGWVTRGSFRGHELMENTRVLPRAFVPRAVHLTRVDVTPDAMKRATDFGAESWIETVGPAATLPNGPGTARLTGEGAHLRVHASMQNRGYVVVSITAWKGWRARSGGRDLPLVFANHAFLGFELPAGEHVVSLDYEPSSFRLGATISVLSLAAMAIGWWRLRRRSPARP